MQNIPSHNREIRMLFCAKTDENTVIVEDSEPFVVNIWDEVETPDGWKKAKQLQVGDKLLVDNHVEIVYNVICNNVKIEVWSKEVMSNEES